MCFNINDQNKYSLNLNSITRLVSNKPSTLHIFIIIHYDKKCCSMNENLLKRRGEKDHTNYPSSTSI